MKKKIVHVRVIEQSKLNDLWTQADFIHWAEDNFLKGCPVGTSIRVKNEIIKRKLPGEKRYIKVYPVK